MNWFALVFFLPFFLLVFGPGILMFLEVLGVKWAKRYLDRLEESHRRTYGRR